MKVLSLVLVGLLLLSAVLAKEKDVPHPHHKKKHHYKEGEVIPFYMNNVGPYSNPTETYKYYSLPFCLPTKNVDDKGKPIKKDQRMGEYIQGDRAEMSDYELPFNTQIPNKKTLCTLTLTKESTEIFKKAIKELYYAEMIYDDLPIFGFIGTTNEYKEGEPIKYYLYNHLNFLIEYNEDQVIRINATTDLYPHELPEPDQFDDKNNPPKTVEFTYTATWTKTDVKYDDRRKYYEFHFFRADLEIHWLSIMNSFVLVILLTGFLAIIIMRVLRSDYARYAKTDEVEDDQADYGWKLVHGDVFRFPPYKNVFSAFLGIGAQFMSMVTGTLLFALFGMYYPTNGGNMYASAIALYAVTAGIGGFVAGRMYKQLNGDQWAWNIVLTATLFAVPFLCMVIYANSVALYFKVTVALRFITILEVSTIWALVGFPLTVLGGIAGKRLSGVFDAPCRTKNFPREIPSIPWYRTLPFQMLMAGFLPFSAIYIELFYIYSSVWGHTFYTLYGILCLVFVILLIVTACITVALTYFQLSMEDHRWWWTAFINGGSTGIFIYIYSIFYYIYYSHMTGLLQGSFYFGYMLVVCYFFFILLGSVGFFSALIFVRRIYRNLHSD